MERELSQVASERAERLGGLLSLSYEPMLVWQLNGPIEFWNTGAERLYGFAPEEAIGHSKLISDFAEGLLCSNMRRCCCCYRGPPAR